MTIRQKTTPSLHLVEPVLGEQPDQLQALVKPALAPFWGRATRCARS